MLRSAGFTAIGTYEMPREGDVIIIQPYAGGNPSGHMAIYDGAEWYSDFKQRDMWAGPATGQPALIYHLQEELMKTFSLSRLSCCFVVALRLITTVRRP